MFAVFCLFCLCLLYFYCIVLCFLYSACVVPRVSCILTVLSCVCIILIVLYCVCCILRVLCPALPFFHVNTRPLHTPTVDRVCFTTPTPCYLCSSLFHFCIIFSAALVPRPLSIRLLHLQLGCPSSIIYRTLIPQLCGCTQTNKHI